MIKPTGACTAGVKVRITRQRMVGKIARHSGADIAAGVTSGCPWHSTGPPGKIFETCSRPEAGVREGRFSARPEADTAVPDLEAAREGEALLPRCGFILRW